MRGIRGLLFAALMAAAVAFPARAEEKVSTITVRDGITMKFIENADAGPRAPIVILMIGGDGRAGLDDWNGGGDPNDIFLTRVRNDFARAGFVTALPDAPSDRLGDPGLGALRRKPIHARDVGKLIAHMRTVSSGPVFVVGTSKGTVSAVTVAAWLPPGTVQGIVLTSALTRMDELGRDGNSPRVATDKVRVPVLIVQHRDDACPDTRAADVPHLAQSLSAAPAVEVAIVSGGGGWHGEVCHPNHAHGFVGVEDEVVARIARWIKAVAAGKPPA